MPTILIADDDRNFLLSFLDGLKANDEDLSVLTAGNGEEAEKILQSRPIDLLVTDLKMPGKDGFELLAYMSRHFPMIPVIIITAFGTPEIEKKFQDFGSYLYLEKPLDFDMLEDKIYDGLKTKSSGFIKGIFLPSFIQLVELEKKTCTLVITSGSEAGSLYFKKGELIHAETGDDEGTSAALRIIGWENAEIQIKGKLKRVPHSIDSSLNYILMESLRLKDEKIKSMKSEPLTIEYDESITLNDGTETDMMLLLEKDQIQTSFFTEKEVKMNVKKLNEAISTLRESLGDALLATDMWSVVDGQTIASFNSQPKADALFNQITDQMNKALKNAGFPTLGKYYLLDLVDKKMAIVVPLGDFQWGMLIDSKKAQLGLLLNVVLPQVIDTVEQAIAG